MSRLAAIAVPFVSVLLVGTSGGSARADEKDDELARELSNIVRDRLAPLRSRIAAVRTLSKMGPAAGAAVPELMAQLSKSTDPEVLPLHEAIAKTLGEIGQPARTALPVLAKAVGRDPDLDAAIQRATDRILIAQDEADVTELIRQLRHKDESLRLRGAKALAKIGPRAHTAGADLHRLMADTDGDVRRAAITALRAIGHTIKPADLVAALVLDLQEPDEGLRLRAVKALSRMGREAASAGSALQAIINDPDTDVRRAVVEALARINPG